MKPLPKIFIIAVIGIIAAGIASVARNYSNPGSGNNPLLATSPPETVVEALLTLEPEISSVKSGADIVLDIKVDTQANNTYGVEGHFTFDPDFISVSTLEPGPFFAQPKELLKTIDPVGGKISYALGSLVPTAGTGTVFKIHAKTKQPTQSLKNIFSFDQNRTKISLEAERGKLYSREETNIIFREQTITILP